MYTFFMSVRSIWVTNVAPSALYEILDIPMCTHITGISRKQCSYANCLLSLCVYELSVISHTGKPIVKCVLLMLSYTPITGIFKNVKFVYNRHCQESSFYAWQMWITLWRMQLTRLNFTDDEVHIESLNHGFHLFEKCFRFMQTVSKTHMDDF